MSETNNKKIYKSQVLYGITWYKVKEKNSNINVFLEALRNDKSKYLVKRHNPKYGQFWAVVTFEQIQKMICKNVYLYEILSPNVYKKVYFDIDSKTDTLEACKEKILERFPNARLQISGYHTSEKHSFHIVLSNYFVKDPLVIQQFCSRNTDLGFDTAVYGKNNLFKCINQSKPKPNAPIQAYLEGDKSLSKHLVLSDFDEDAQEVSISEAVLIERQQRPQIEAKERQKTSKEPLDLLNDINPKNNIYELEDDFDYINALSRDKLRVIPLNHRNTDDTLNHRVIWKVMVWCKNENISFEEFWQWCKQKEDTESRKCRYMDYWEAAEKYNTNETFIDTILYRFYPFLKEDDYRKKYRIMNTIDPTTVITNQWLSGQDISKEKKITYLNIRMGGNKTGAVLEFIKSLDENATILFITPRIALSADILGRMNNIGLEFENYKDISNKSELVSKDRLICSVQSLHYLADKQYDYVIIDEIETVWPSFSGEAQTHKEHVNSNWTIFLRMVETSKKTIIMDALMSRKTLKIFETENSEIITLEKQQEPRTYIKYKPSEINKWLGRIYNSLKNGEKIIIFMPYKNRNTTSSRHPLTGIYQLVKWISNEFNLEEGVDVIGYFAEARKEKEDLINIEDIWKRARCIVANTCIAVGNNYSGEDFDKIYAYFSHWVATNDFLQFLYRIRNPKEKNMIIFYERKHMQIEKMCRHKIIIENEKFKYLRAGFLIEDNTDPLLKLQVLMKKLNISEVNINEDQLSEFPKINLDEFMINYNDIPNITESEYEKIMSDIDKGFSSLIERFSFEKYRQRKVFIEDTPEIILEIFWNIGDNVLNGLKNLTNNDSHLLNEILNELGHPDFLKFISSYKIVDLCSLRVPKCITNDNIKNNIKLKNNIVNRDTELVARIINAVFGKRVISSVRQGRKYAQIYVPTKKLGENYKKMKKQVVLYNFEKIRYSKDGFIEFEKLCEYYKTYSKKYSKQNKEKCLIDDDEQISGREKIFDCNYKKDAKVGDIIEKNGEFWVLDDLGDWCML